MTRTQIIAFRLALLTALAVIAHLATTPLQYPVIKDFSDKANHILAFYVLALLLDFSFPKANLGIAKVFGLLTYGIMIEAIQSLIPNRMASLLDVAADGIGIALYRVSLPFLRQIPLLRRRWRPKA
jgi:VanZ family protein